jgi:UPF0755 protein
MMNEHEPKKNKKIIVATATVLWAIILLTAWAFLPPFSFPKNSTVTIEEGTGLQTLALRLKEEKVIRSPFWFRIFAIAMGGERDMKAGTYYFDRSQGTFNVAWRIFHGDYGVETVRITIPEGFTVKKISALFDEKFSNFDNEFFEMRAPEGYLFPDTYFIQVTSTASSTIKLLNDNFRRRLNPLEEDIIASGKTLEEIITMASIIESEAKYKEDREIISGILWKRIENNIPLQVDASFIYVNGKTTKDLTLDDLKIDSPFNTYLYRGLPPAPISNPGLESIRAALNPTSSPYLYFLTGNDGTMHYSKTFEEHVEKKLRYLRRQ